MPKVSRYSNDSNLIYIRSHQYVSQYWNHVMTSHACLRHMSFNMFATDLVSLTVYSNFGRTVIGGSEQKRSNSQLLSITTFHQLNSMIQI